MQKQKLWLPKPHHSAADWDISLPYWAMSTEYYISPPSSIYYAQGVTAWPAQLCKNAACLKLPQGRLVTWVRPSDPGNSYGFSFRNIAPVGQANNNNCYYFERVPSEHEFHLYERQDGVNIREWIRETDTHPYGDWRRYRLSWWVSNWDLIAAFDLWKEGEWVQQDNVITIVNPLFGDEDIQRIGLHCKTWHIHSYTFFDDTEVWEIKPE